MRNLKNKFISSLSAFFVLMVIMSLTALPVFAITDAIPTMTSNTTPSGHQISADNVYATGCEAYRAFKDDGETSYWYTGTALNHWLRVYFNSGYEKAINGYGIRPYSTGNYAPKSWQFQASQDGTTWTTLDTRENVTFSNLTGINVFTFTNTTVYKMYRIYITASTHGSGYILIDEMEFYQYVPPTLQSISVTPATKTLNISGTQQLIVTANYSDNSTQDITSTSTYSSNDTSVATVASDGLITAISDGTATITATYQTETATCDLTVYTPTLSNINVGPSSNTLCVNHIQQLTTTATYSDNSTDNVTNSAAYTSSNTSIATISSTGLITAVSPGSASIQVAYQNESATVNIIVINADIVSISCNPNPITLSNGETQQLTITATLSDDVTDDITSLAELSSSNNAIASVDTSGRIMAVSVGSTSINIKYENISTTVNVTVGDPTVVSIFATPNPVILLQGSTKQLTVLATLSNGSVQNVSSLAAYSSNNSSIATVNSTGLITAVSKGKTSIDISYQGKSITANVEISDSDWDAIEDFLSFSSTEDHGWGGGGAFEDYLGKSCFITRLQYADERRYLYKLNTNYENGISVNGSDDFVVETSLTMQNGSSGMLFTIQDDNTLGFCVAINDHSIELHSTNGLPTYSSIAPYAVNMSNGWHKITMRKNGTQYGEVYLDGELIFANVELQGIATGLPWYAHCINLTTGGPGSYYIDYVNFSKSGYGVPDTIQSIKSNYNPVILSKGKTKQVAINAYYSDGTTENVTSPASYSSANSAIATISSAGLIQAVSQGSTTVNASYGGKATTVNVTVTNPVVDSLSATPNPASIPKGLTEQLAIIANYSDSTTQDVTSAVYYSAYDNSIAAINTSGLITAILQGSSSVSAAYQGKSTSIGVTITDPIAMSLTAIPNEVSIPKGLSEQISITANMSDSTTQDVTSAVYYLDYDTSIVTVDSDGLITAELQGNTDITTTYQNKSTEVSVTVTDPIAMSISSETDSTEIPKGLTEQLSIEALLSDETTQDVTSEVYYSNYDSSIINIDNDGLVTAVSQGSTNIDASYEGKGTLLSVTVTDPIVLSLSAAPNPASIPKGLTEQLAITANYSDSTTQDVTSAVYYSDNDNSIATINTGGLITAILQGSTNVSVAYQGKTTSIGVTITDPIALSLAATPDEVNIPKGLTEQVSITANMSDSTTQDVTFAVYYTGNDSSIATIDSNGLITAELQGNTDVTAMYQGKSTDVSVTITDPIVMSISAEAEIIELPKGLEEQLSIEALLSDDTTQDVTSEVYYSNYDDSIISIDSSGLVTAVSRGSTTIDASYEGEETTVSVTVTDLIVTSISAEPDTIELPKGLTEQLSIEALLSDDTTQDVTSEVYYSNYDSSIININSSGLVTAISQGSTSIDASYEGEETTVSVSVTDPVIVSLSATPDEASIAEGLTEQLTIIANYSDDTTQDVTSAVYYSDYDTSIISIDEDGLITAILQGNTSIDAGFQGKAITVDVTVTEQLGLSPTDYTDKIVATLDYKVEECAENLLI